MQKVFYEIAFRYRESNIKGGLCKTSENKCGNFKVFFQRKSIEIIDLVWCKCSWLCSEVNNQDIGDNYYRQGDLIGRQGIEKSYENELRGKKGKSSPKGQI